MVEKMIAPKSLLAFVDKNNIDLLPSSNNIKGDSAGYRPRNVSGNNNIPGRIRR
jgi:hypothetical protein